MRNSLKVLKTFPPEVQDGIGYALHKVQLGLVPKNVKLLRGFKHPVMEIVTDYDTNTFRVVYTVKISGGVYVLHCFQKKSTQGIKTPKQELALVRQRLRDAELINQSERYCHE